MEEKLYSIAEVAKLTGKAIVTVRQLTQRHGFGRKVGRAWILTDTDLEAIRNVPPPGHPTKDRMRTKKPPVP